MSEPFYSVHVYENLSFYKEVQQSMFNTNPDYFNSQGDKIDYYIQFSTQPSVFGTIPDFSRGENSIDLVTNPSYRLPNFENKSCIVAGDESYFLSGTLPEKIKIEDLTGIYQRGFRYVANSGNFFTAGLDVAYNKKAVPTSNIFKERSLYQNATKLVTRYDSSTDLTQILFVFDDEGHIASPSDVFKREFEKAFNNYFKDENSGICLALLDVTSAGLNEISCWVYDYEDEPIENPSDSTWNEDKKYLRNHYTSNVNTATVKNNTIVNLVDFSTTPPVINYSTLPSNIYTFDQTNTNLEYITSVSGVANTAPVYLSIDFDRFSSISLTKKTIIDTILNSDRAYNYNNGTGDYTGQEAIAVTLCTYENNSITGVIARADIFGYVLPTGARKQRTPLNDLLNLNRRQYTSADFLIIDGDSAFADFDFNLIYSIAEASKLITLI